MSDSEAAVLDDVEQHRFVLVQDGATAELVYRAEAGRLILTHTYVPDALRHRGIGGRLVQAAVERAQRSSETVAPWCPFARTWIEGHPSETAGVTIDSSEPPGPARP